MLVIPTLNNIIWPIWHHHGHCFSSSAGKHQQNLNSSALTRLGRKMSFCNALVSTGNWLLALQYTMPWLPENGLNSQKHQLGKHVKHSSGLKGHNETNMTQQVQRQHSWNFPRCEDKHRCEAQKWASRRFFDQFLYRKTQTGCPRGPCSLSSFFTHSSDAHRQRNLKTMQVNDKVHKDNILETEWSGEKERNGKQ